MEIDKLNSLVELYFKKCEEVDPNRPFLKWLKPGKPTYTWGDIKDLSLIHISEPTRP